jgi:hypothetical protein
VGPRALYIGVPIGFGLAFPAGWSGGISPDPALLWTALPLTGLTLWWLHAWVRHGTLSVSTLHGAVVALLVNFLAAGGVGFAGVGQLIWWLAALLADSASPVATTSPAGKPSRVGAGAVLQAAALLVLAAGAAGCYATMYRPVLLAREHMANARQAGSAEASERAVLAAAAADGWWGEPWEILAQLDSERWQVAPDTQTLERFRMREAQFRVRDCHASRVERRCGDWWLEMYAVAPAEDVGREAVAAYQRAAALYPQSALLRAQLAWAHYLVGEGEAARSQAAEAERLDRQMPHAELKLGQQRITAAAATPLGGRPAADAMWTAEQFVEFLRKWKDD